MPQSSQNDKFHLGMAGEFLVAAELNRRDIHAAVTYGTAKSADIWAFKEDANRAIRLEVKTTPVGTKKWVVGAKAMECKRWHPDLFWVLVMLPKPHPMTAETDDIQRGQHTPRFFVLTSEEMGTLLWKAHNRYKDKYFAKHNREYTSKGVYGLETAEAEPFENAWHKVIDRLSLTGEAPSD